MYSLYSVLVLVLAVLASPWFIYQAVRYKKYVRSLGQRMGYLQTYGLNDQIYALALATGLLGVAIHFTLVAIERRVLRWHPSQRKVAAP